MQPLWEGVGHANRVGTGGARGAKGAVALAVSATARGARADPWPGHPPRPAYLFGCRTDHPVLSGSAGLPAGRARGEPRLPGLLALLLRPRQPDAARLLRLSRPRPGSRRRVDRFRPAHRDIRAARPL